MKPERRNKLANKAVIADCKSALSDKPIPKWLWALISAILFGMLGFCDKFPPR